MYVLEIFIGPLLIAFGLLMVLGFALVTVLVLALVTFFLTLLVLGIFQFEFEGVYSAK